MDSLTVLKPHSYFLSSSHRVLLRRLYVKVRVVKLKALWKFKQAL